MRVWLAGWRSSSSSKENLHWRCWQCGRALSRGLGVQRQRYDTHPYNGGGGGGAPRAGSFRHSCSPPPSPSPSIPSPDRSLFVHPCIVALLSSICVCTFVPRCPHFTCVAKVRFIPFLNKYLFTWELFQLFNNKI